MSCSGVSSSSTPNPTSHCAQMSAVDEDIAISAQYESSSTLLSSESASLYSSNNGDVMAGPPSGTMNVDQTMVKPKAP